MKTVKFLFLFAVAAFVAAGCKQKASYKKTPGGMPYQVYSSKDTQKVRLGNFIKLSFTQKLRDSILFTTENGLPVYIPVMDQKQPYDISEIWTELKLNDSVVTTQMVDTFMKRFPGQLPPQFKKGDRLTSRVKVLGIFANDSLKSLDETKERNAFMAREVTVVEKYVSDKKITAQKTPSGAFVEITEPGTGIAADSGKYVTVKYTGTSFSGKKFDSNVDTSFHHTEPLGWTIGSGQMIKGFDEGVRFLKQGGKGRIFIPSMLGYGPQPGSPNIKPYEHLIFDVEVLEVKAAAPVRKEMMPPPPPQQEKVDTHQH